MALFFDSSSALNTLASYCLGTGDAETHRRIYGCYIDHGDGEIDETLGGFASDASLAFADNGTGDYTVRPTRRAISDQVVIAAAESTAGAPDTTVPLTTIYSADMEDDNEIRVKVWDASADAAADPAGVSVLVCGERMELFRDGSDLRPRTALHEDVFNRCIVQLDTTPLEEGVFCAAKLTNCSSDPPTVTNICGFDTSNASRVAQGVYSLRALNAPKEPPAGDEDAMCVAATAVDTTLHLSCHGYQFDADDIRLYCYDEDGALQDPDELHVIALCSATSGASTTSAVAGLAWLLGVGDGDIEGVRYACGDITVVAASPSISTDFFTNGLKGITRNAAGDYTITYDDTYSAIPFVVATVIEADTDYHAFVVERSTTAVRIRVADLSATHAAGTFTAPAPETLDVNVIAFGVVS